MFAFILESIGSTELLFILAIALIFFGPRKLPQLAKSMGKGLSEFRKASDDFKRTWEREVALESVRADGEHTIHEPQELSDDGDANLLNEDANLLNEPQLEPADPELVVARESSLQTPVETSSEPPPVPAESNQPEPLRKHDWL